MIIMKDNIIEFDSPEKEIFREMLSTGEYSIYVSWYSPVRLCEQVHFTCYPGKVYLRSVYEHGPFFSLEEAEDYIFQAEKNELDHWYYEEGGETAFWHYSPSGRECPPPDFSKYGYRAVEGPSDYWWIEPI